MRLLTYCCLAMTSLFATDLYAGQVYGSVTSEDKGLAQAQIEINCGGAISSGATAPDGSYRISVAKEGQCTFTLPQYAGPPSAVVFSRPSPALYNFDLVRRPDGKYDLRAK